MNFFGEMSMIKFLHAADLHLDSPFSALPPDKAEVRRAEFRAAFTSLTMYARMNKIDFLFLPGDLFDSDYASRDTVALMRREFANLPDCRVIIAPGNHDPFTGTSYYRRAEFPDNVFIFDTDELGAFEFPDKNTTVYGWAFTSGQMTKCPLDSFEPEDRTRINILCAHGDLGKSGSVYCPISYETLEKSGLDYAALGHIHEFSGVKQYGGTWAAYSGCLESRGFDELGAKGAVIGAAEKENGETKLGAKFIRFSKRVYESETLDVTGAEDNAEITEKIGAMIAGNHYGEDTALRLILTGSLPSGVTVSKSFIQARFPRLFLIETIDRTMPLLDAAALERDPTIRGAFYRSLKDKLGSPDENERETAAAALRYGLAALAGADVVDF